MAVWSEVRSSGLEDTIRFDAEYYHPAYLEFARELRRIHSYPLGALAFITDGQHGYFNLDEHSEIRQITAKHIIGGLVDRSSADRLSVETHNKNLRSSLQAGDVLVTTAGTIGVVGYVTEDVPPANIDQDVARIHIQDSRLQPLFLWIFLQTRFGQFQIDRFSTGQVQRHLSLSKTRNLRVPIRLWQENIVAIAQAYIDCIQRSSELYLSTQEILENELGIDKIDLSPRVGYATHLSELFQSRRWDGEFYKPKYQRVLDAVLNAKKVKVERFVPVGQLLSYLTNGHTPLHHDLEVGEVPFLTAEHVSDFRVDFGTDKRILRRQHETELARTDLHDGDILMTIKGKVGNCAIVRNCPDFANINQDVALVRLRNGIHPYFFAAWFNSLMGKQLVEQRSTGGINPFLGLGNLRGMSFPVLDPKEHNRIGDLVQETVESAYAAEQEASALLERAKRQVEELIEREAA